MFIIFALKEKKEIKKNSLLFKSRIGHQLWKKAFLYLNDKPFAIDKKLLYWTQHLYENYTYSIFEVQISTLLKLQ